MKPPISGYPQSGSTGSPNDVSPQSLFPRLLVGMRNTLEHVTELVPTRDGRELADLLVVDRIVAHPLDYRHDDPLVGDELHQPVIHCRPLAGGALFAPRPVVVVKRVPVSLAFPLVL